MKDAIQYKLAQAMSAPITTEAQAVYVMVEVRKLLDRRKGEGLPELYDG